MILQKNPDHGKWTLPKGYKDLGWNLHLKNSKEIESCVLNG